MKKAGLVLVAVCFVISTIFPSLPMEKELSGTITLSGA